MRDTVKVLFLASDPFRDRAPLRLDEEVRAIEHALQRGSAREGVELIPCFATRIRDLQYALLRHEPQIVHFAGHGGDTGVLYLGDEHGRPRPVGREALAKLFGLLRERTRVVILNGCDTLPTVDALGEVVDYAIGMNRPLTDPSAIVFARAFYGTLAMGEAVKASFDFAVNQLELEQNPEATTPVLRIRPGVDPAVPLVAPPPASPAAAPAAGGGAGAQPTTLPDGQVINIGKLRGDGTVWENRPGSDKKDTQRINIDEATGNGYVFRNG
jgi:hypothetical protein